MINAANSLKVILYTSLKNKKSESFSGCKVRFAYKIINQRGPGLEVTAILINSAVMIHEIMRRLVGALAWEWWEMGSTRLFGSFLFSTLVHPLSF